MPEDGPLVVLVGNGLSVAVLEKLHLARLTERFLGEHDEDRDDLDRLLAEVNLGDVDPERDFEGIVAGLESAEEVVTTFMGLASREGRRQQRPVLLHLLLLAPHSAAGPVCLPDRLAGVSLRVARLDIAAGLGGAVLPGTFLCCHSTSPTSWGRLPQ
jgi:hypothetical protein